MKSLKMNKVFGTIRRKNTHGPDVNAQPDSPEAVAANSVKAFCESDTTNNSGDEVLYLPPIVDAAESSPQAAAECARLIRKYLKKDYWTKPSYQYNALMLMRILSDNPGQTFTRNLDQKFVDTAKDLLRNGRDPSVLQMLMETLHSFEATKSYDEGMTLLLEMWKKEKEKAQKSGGHLPYHPPRGNGPPFGHGAPIHQPGDFSRPPRGLPNPVELASRLEEARTSAKLLQEVVANTPPGEVLSNDFMKEFADRCKTASRSVQGYMAAENPAPDNDTMESLIDTNEQLQAALHLHQRALLNAKKQAGINTPAETGPDFGLAVANGTDSSRRPSAVSAEDSDDYEPPPSPPRRPSGNGKGKGRDYSPAVAGSSRSTPPPEDDPFRDPAPEQSGSSTGGAPRLAFEPFHPGFGTTPSYTGRQESAVGKEAMHGAVPASSGDDDSDIYEVTPGKTKDKAKDSVYRY